MDCSTNYLSNSDQFPIETFNYVISFSPLQSRNFLAQTCQELNMRINLIKEDFFAKLVTFDLKQDNKDEHKSFKLYLLELNYLNSLSQKEMPANRSKKFAKIKILSQFEWKIIYELYEHLDIIEELDFSRCLTNELMPEDDPGPHWMHGLFEGMNIIKIDLPADFPPFNPNAAPTNPIALMPVAPIAQVAKKNFLRKFFDRVTR